MPTFQRKQLRTDLGIKRLNDTIVGTTIWSIGAGATVYIIDPVLPNGAQSGEQIYTRAFLRVASVDYRVASFNYPSGAAVTGQVAINAIVSGMDYEIHQKVAPADKDRCIDEAIAKFRVRQEVGFPSIDGQRFYSLSDAVASPNTILEVLNVWYYANPASTQNRDQRFWPERPVVALTATGRELRIPSALTWSQQIVLDCLLQVTLGASDAATVNIPLIPNDNAILDGAAAQAYDLLIQKTPGQEDGRLINRRKEMGIRFTRAMEQQQAEQESALGFEAPF